MKKFMILVLCTMFAVNVFAQKSAIEKTKSFLKLFEYTINVGLGRTASTTPYDQSKVTMDFGVDVKKDITSFSNDKFMLYGLVGFHFSPRGGKMDNMLDGAGSASGNDFKESQFNIPIHVGVKYKINDKFKLFADAGPFIGINGSAELGSGYGHNDYVLESNPLDFGLGLNLGVCFKKFGISVGLDKGFLNIAKFSSEEKNISENLKSSCINIKLQWTFNQK